MGSALMASCTLFPSYSGQWCPGRGGRVREGRYLFSHLCPRSMYLWVSQALLCSNRISFSSLLPCMPKGLHFQGALKLA